jgi:signal peptidase II
MAGMGDPEQQSRPERPLAAALLFAGLAAVVVVADQASKLWVDSSFEPAWTRRPVAGFADPTPVVGDLVRIAKTYNDGGIFGLFDAAAPVLAMLSIAVIGFILLYWIRSSSRRPNLMTVALGLLLGGALGNLIDRIRLGRVIDWVDTGIGDLRFYTFNVADSAISIAIVLLLGLSLFADRLASRTVVTAPPTKPLGAEPADASPGAAGR